MRNCNMFRIAVVDVKEYTLLAIVCCDIKIGG